MKPCLIIGAGDIAQRILPLLKGEGSVFALCRTPENQGIWRSLGATPLMGDLDDPDSLRRLAGLAHTVLHFAPPSTETREDHRTRHLINALARGRSLPQSLIYISTTGVYGSSGGNWLEESNPVRPQTLRAQRRVSAEHQLRAFGRRSGCRIVILRAPGIYAADRLPLDRLRRQDPLPQNSPWTNHIHAFDLARAAQRAIFLGLPQRLYNAVDDQPLPLDEFYQQLALHYQLPLPPRLPLDQLIQQLNPFNLSFMMESRRIKNHRIKQELRLNWRYPDIGAFLKE
ncbi:MAG: SDR family oxidoreductase [Ferrovum sp.]|nr:SDR family oxidoreductase [Ferrovum sp.]NDU88164.1 SDR family oxidoreductase [Ferrovum sp.]